MIGNVSGIVNSMFAADNARNSRNTANTNTGNSFSDYLNYAFLNSSSGALFGNGIGSNYSYMNGLSGSIWQTFALKSLIDGIQKNNQTTAGTTTAASDTKQENSESVSGSEKKPDWAKIRVLQYYNTPTAQQSLKSRGILV